MSEELEFFKRPEPITQCDETVECDVAVVGAGSPGVPCAIRAGELGMKVAVLQKELNDLCDENDRRKAKEATEQKTTAATPAAQPSSGRRILQALHLTPRQPKVPDGQSNTPEGKA